MRRKSAHAARATMGGTCLGCPRMRSACARLRKHASTLRRHARAQTHAGACAFTRTPCAADAGHCRSATLSFSLSLSPSSVFPLFLSSSLPSPFRAERRCVHSVLQLYCGQCLCLMKRVRAQVRVVCARASDVAHTCLEKEPAVVEAVVGDVPGQDLKCVDVDLGSTIGFCLLGQGRQLQSN